MNALVMLPRGNSYARGKVVRQERDAYKNAVGSTTDNPIIDTRGYRVEFYDGDVRKLTENVI